MPKLPRPAGRRPLPEGKEKKIEQLKVKKVVEQTDSPSIEQTEGAEATEEEKEYLEACRELESVSLEVNEAEPRLPKKVKVSVPLDKDKEERKDVSIREELLKLLREDSEVRGEIMKMLPEVPEKETVAEPQEKWKGRFRKLEAGMPLDEEISLWLDERGLPGVGLVFDEMLCSKDEGNGFVNVVWIKNGKPVGSVNVPTGELFENYRK